MHHHYITLNLPFRTKESVIRNYYFFDTDHLLMQCMVSPGRTSRPKSWIFITGSISPIKFVKKISMFNIGGSYIQPWIDLLPRTKCYQNGLAIVIDWNENYNNLNCRNYNQNKFYYSLMCLFHLKIITDCFKLLKCPQIKSIHRSLLHVMPLSLILYTIHILGRIKLFLHIKYLLKKSTYILARRQMHSQLNKQIKRENK